MKMSDVRVGMRLAYPISLSPITVTEITERGFKFKLDAPLPFTARDGSHYPIEGYEHIVFNGETFYEPEL